MVDSPTNGATAQTGAHLVIAIAIFAGVVGFNPVDFVIFHVQPQRTAAAAVNGASAPDHFIVFTARLLHGRCRCSQGERQR